MKIITTGLPASLEDYQAILNATFEGGKVYGALAEREACAKDAEWCIQNHIEQHIPERIRARGNP